VSYGTLITDQRLKVLNRYYYVAHTTDLHSCNQNCQHLNC